MKVRIHNPIYGVPFTAISKLNLSQFYIIGILGDNKVNDVENGIYSGSPVYIDAKHKHRTEGVINKKSKYMRLLIKRK